MVRTQLKHILWPSRTCPVDFEEAEREQLAPCFVHSPALKQALALREELARIFATARSKVDELRRIGFWRARVINVCC